MTPENLWQEFVKKFPKYKGKSYDTFSFGDRPDELLKLVLTGQKIATSCLYRGNPSNVKDISIILDSTGRAHAIIETTKVSIVPFSQVSREFAQKEGEGDKSLETWRKIHLAFWGDIPSNTLLECEEFKVLYKKEYE